MATVVVAVVVYGYGSVVVYGYEFGEVVVGGRRDDDDVVVIYMAMAT